MGRKVGLMVGAWLVILLSVTVAAQIVVPLQLSRRVQAALEDNLQASGLQVRVQVFPIFKLLGGGIDKILVEGENLAAGDLNLDRLEAAVTSLRLDVPRLWRHGTVTWRDPGQARLRVEVSEASLNQYLQAHLGSRVKVMVKPGEVHVLSSLVVGGEETPVAITGVPVLTPARNLAFQVKEISLAGQAVPQVVRDLALRFAGMPEARLDFGSFPWPVQPEEVRAEEGKVVLVAGGGTHDLR